MVCISNPRTKQENKFFGLSGVETLDGGLSGRYTQVKGVLTGVDVPTIASAREFFRSFDDGLAGVLIDTTDVIWPNVRMENFAPAERILYDPAGWGYVIPYTARFFHLS